MKKHNSFILGALALVAALPATLFAAEPAPAYTVTEVAPPEGVTLEVGDLAVLKDGTLALSTRRGNVWMLKDGAWHQFAMGLQEPLGLVEGDKPGELFILQRPELTRLVDEDGDGVCDLYQTVARGWGFTGNYHEYAMAFTRGKDGSFYGGLGLPFFTGSPFQGKWLGTMEVKDRGWYFHVSPDGKYEKWAPGVREPVGAAFNDADDLFISDTQGSFICTNWIMHVEKGDFLGHPEAFLLDERWADQVAKWKAMPTEERNAAFNALRKRPAVYIPYRIMGNSIGGIAFDRTNGKFGPFAGQMLVGEINQSMINRVSLEKVNGVYQGAVYRLYDQKDLGGGNHKFAFAPDGSLYVGQTARGWGNGQGLKQLRFTGEIPFDLREIKLLPNGFTLAFTQPVTEATLAKLTFERFRYEYTNAYVAGELDRTDLKAGKATLSADGLTATVMVEGLEPDRVVLVNYSGVESSTGATNHFGRCWYTINQLAK